MQDIYNLEEKLIKEVAEYGSKNLTLEAMKVLEPLARTAKNVMKIADHCEAKEYSGAVSGRRAYSRRGSYGMDGAYASEAGESGYSRNSYLRPDGSYARGRRGAVNRDSMGRYSRAGEDFKSELHELMEMAPDERSREELRKLVERM